MCRLQCVKGRFCTVLHVLTRLSDGVWPKPKACAESHPQTGHAASGASGTGNVCAEARVICKQARDIKSNTLLIPTHNAVAALFMKRLPS